MRVLVTGGSGFVGTNLIRKLLDKGYSVIDLDIVPPHEDVASEIDYVELDLSDCSNNALKKLDFDYVVHLAALSSPQLCDDAAKTYFVNVDGMDQLLTCIKGKDIKKMVFMSTALLYSPNQEMPFTENSRIDDDQNLYTKTKSADESMCLVFEKDNGIPLIIFRPTNMYGPYQDYKHKPTLIPQAISQALIEEKIDVWTIEPERDFVYVGDACDAIIKGLESSYTGILNLSYGTPVKVGKIVETISQSLGVPVKVEGKEVNGPMKVICSNELLKEKLGWEPAVNLEEGLEKTIRFYKKSIRLS